MEKVLEGNELEKEYDGGAGKLILDADAKGNLKFSNVYAKNLDGYAVVSSQISLESNILNIAEKIAAKTGTTWDDAAIKGIKAILGIE